jgi:hypothetical protein
MTWSVGYIGLKVSSLECGGFDIRRGKGVNLRVDLIAHDLVLLVSVRQIGQGKTKSALDSCSNRRQSCFVGSQFLARIVDVRVSP